MPKFNSNFNGGCHLFRALRQSRRLFISYSVDKKFSFAACDRIRDWPN